jgi:hypothetical protein
MRSNGLNFSKSITNPNSVIARILIGLTFEGPRTKKYILRRILGKTLDLRTARGYFSYYFAEGRERGLLRYDAKTQTWSLDENGRLLAKTLARTSWRGSRPWLQES